MGPTAENLIVGVAGTGATLVNVNNTIIGSGTIGQGDGTLTLINGANGTIEATPLAAPISGLLIIDTGNGVQQFRLLTAAAGGTLQIADNVSNLGLIQAQAGSAVVIAGRTNNSNTIEANGSGAEVSLTGDVINEFSGRHRLRLPAAWSCSKTASTAHRQWRRHPRQRRGLDGRPSEGADLPRHAGDDRRRRH